MLCITLLTASTSAYAATVPSGDISSAKKALTNYLEAAKNKDVKALIDLSDDARVKSDREYAQLLQDAYKVKDNEIKSYSVGNGYKVDDTNSDFITTIKYANNNSTTVTMNVIKKNNKYVVVTGQDVDESGKPVDTSKNYNATVENYSKADAMFGSVKTVGNRLTTWSKRLTGSYPGNQDYTYNINSCSSSVYLNYRQYDENTDNECIKVYYAIVSEGVIYDTIYAEATSIANDGGRSAYKLTLNPGARNNVKLKMRNDSWEMLCSGGLIPVVRTWGEIYNCY